MYFHSDCIKSDSVQRDVGHSTTQWRVTAATCTSSIRRCTRGVTDARTVPASIGWASQIATYRASTTLRYIPVKFPNGLGIHLLTETRTCASCQHFFKNFYSSSLANFGFMIKLGILVFSRHIQKIVPWIFWRAALAAAFARFDPAPVETQGHRHRLPQDGRRGRRMARTTTLARRRLARSIATVGHQAASIGGASRQGSVAGPVPADSQTGGFRIQSLLH